MQLKPMQAGWNDLCSDHNWQCQWGMARKSLRSAELQSPAAKRVARGSRTHRMQDIHFFPQRFQLSITSRTVKLIGRRLSAYLLDDDNIRGH